MLFQKDIEPRCCYCQRGTKLDEEQVLCVKKGVVSPGGSCRSFRYDPLKRVPPRPAKADTRAVSSAPATSTAMPEERWYLVNGDKAEFSW